jgi:hypothetical protein
MTAYVGNFPDNINPLNPNGFRFDLQRVPGLSYFCQSVNLPSLILGEPNLFTPFAQVPIPGETLLYGELSIEFLVDENLANWKLIHNWLIALGFPQSYDQYINFDNEDQRELTATLSRNYSDGTLTILNNNNQPTAEVHFVDMFPVTLDQLTFDTKVQDVQYVTGRCTFRFSYYEFL